ncbi:MAG: hypothetical protein E7399_05980 [Ruminococcaceae bacterium]|nr:hypothetical protein [Oscillospiraceae bacterium]
MKKPLLSEMTLREKIGQCLMPQQWDIYQKTEISVNIERTEEERKALLEKEQFGCFWAEQIGVRNIKLTDLTEHWGDPVMSDDHKRFMQAQSDCLKIPSLNASDAESGCSHIFRDCSRVSTALAIGAANSTELAYELGACVARELRCGGVNWWWSPVVDISSRFAPTGIGRSFAPDNPDAQIAFANAQIKGIQDQGVAATAKHFPGCDRYEYRDAHFCQTSISSSMDEWWEEQGKIFQGVIEGGVYSVMVGHTAFPAADDTKIKGTYVPATLSKKIIIDLLKNQMGFEGVAITDSILMASLFSLYDYDELVVHLINAGNDVLLGCLRGTGDIIEQAVLDGRISESRIDDACQRVLNMKEKIGLFRDDYRDITYKAEDIVPQTASVCKKIAEKSMTLVRDRNHLLPLKQEEIKHVAIICSAHFDPFFDQLQVVKEEFEKRGATVHLQRRLTSNEEMKKLSEENDLIVYAAYVSGHRPKGGLALYGDECGTYIYAFTNGKEKSLGVSFGYPYIHYDIMENADAFVNAYSPDEMSMKAFAAAIYGEIPFEGVSPVRLKPFYDRW